MNHNRTHLNQLGRLRTLSQLMTCALLILCTVVETKAQTDAQFSQYYEVPSYYNPAAIGLTENLRFRGGGRMQWVGIDNAPQVFMGTADAPFKLGKKRIGVGLYTESESAGLFNSLNIGAQVAYKLRKWGGELSIGMMIGMYDQRFDGRDVFIPDDNDYHESNDDAIPKKEIHGVALDLDFGLWYTHPKFWAGLSCTHLTEPTITMKNEGTSTTAEAYIYEFQAKRTLYLMGGCNIPVKNTLFELMPSVLLKSDLTFTVGEATLRARYNKFMLMGLGYRWRDGFSAMIGAELKDFYIGYCFEYSTSAIARASYGSHEVFLGYSMKLDLSDKNKNKHKSIRIM